MNVRVKVSLITVRYNGNIENSMVNTTMFKVGELNIVAKVVSSLAPPSCMPFATGAAQLTHTPNGVPTATPINVLTKLLSQSQMLLVVLFSLKFLKMLHL